MAKTRRVPSTSTLRRSNSKKTRNNGQWTEARFNSFVASALRAASRRWPPKWEVLKQSLVGIRLNKATKREGKHYRCQICTGIFPSSQVQVDHIKPIGDWSDWNKVVNALFCEADNLQAVCKPCHLEKTKKEKAKLHENKKDN